MINDFCFVVTLQRSVVLGFQGVRRTVMPAA